MSNLTVLRKGWVVVAALLLLLASFTSTSYAQSPPGTSPKTYYVSPNGSNLNPGTAEQPWATPAFGARQLQPGDTLIIRSGTYILRDFGEDVIVPPSGRADAWITIKGEEGDRPVLVGTDNLMAAINLSGASYVRIENLEITSDQQHPFREGINAWEPAAHIILDNLYIHHLDEMGIDLRDIDDLQLLNSRIEYCGFGAVGGPTGEQGGWRNILIRGCRLSYSGHYYQGVIDNPNNPYDRPDGFGIEPSDGPVEIADTIVEHNRGDGLDSKADNTYIHNCIVANNSCDGIKVWGSNSKIENCLIYGTGDGDAAPTPWAGLVIDQVETPGAYFEIVNTTVHDNPQRTGYPMYVQYDSTTPITLVMRNSIVSGGEGVVYIGDAVNFTAEHNIFYRPGQSVQVHANGRDYAAEQIEAGELGPGNISRDPLFVSPAWGTEGDYHLQAGSPAIDSGTATGAPTIDLEYRSRPAGEGYDIGAYEFSSRDEEPLIWEPKTISDKYKAWTIRFNMPVDASTITGQNITVTDASSNQVDVIVEPGSDGRSAIVTPVKAYPAGQVYYLNIGKGIKSTSGKFLKRPVIMQFTISEST